MTIDTKRYTDGKFMLLRKGGSKPRAFHSSFAKAEAEAARKLSADPDATIVVLQEVARIKVRGGGSSSAPCCPPAAEAA